MTWRTVFVFALIALPTVSLSAQTTDFGISVGYGSYKLRWNMTVLNSGLWEKQGSLMKSFPDCT